MKGSECKLLQYMEGSSNRYIIPVYQRNYDWKKENCKQLYDDLIKVVKNDRKSHFFGSIVSVYEPAAGTIQFLIIDGQQRLTTVSLLLLAMYNLINEGKVTPKNDYLAKKIQEEYLVDKYQPKETRIKLKPVKNDNKAFSKLFEEKDEHVKSSNLTANYDYFYERIQRNEISIDDLYDAIFKLEIINITLTGDDNPQLIFESLNSTGLDLSEGDKIRNFILMGLTAEEQNDYYEKYWNRIEENTNYDVSAFARDYLSIKRHEIPSLKKVYAVFKDYVETSMLETEGLLKELLSYAKRYQILLNGNSGIKDLDSCIYRLNRLETTVTRPFFLEVLRLFQEERIDKKDLLAVFTITENYLFRRSICDIPTNALNKIFLHIHREILRYDGTLDNYVEKLKYALTSKSETSRFPSDTEFSTMFMERNIYHMNSKNKVYLLERLENFGTEETKAVYENCDSTHYTIEHIMPQYLKKEWIESLGENYEEIHKTWLHRIGNLTLTAYNPEYSNNTFENKKTRKNGFIESGLKMNLYIASFDKWTLAELEKRSEYLKNKALNIWEYPKTDFVPEQKPLDYFSLDDEDMIFTGRHISSFTYKNTEEKASSWAGMFVQVVKILYEENKAILATLAASDEKNLAAYFSYNKNDFSSSEAIGDGIYLFTHHNTKSKFAVLKRLFHLYDVDPSYLVFSLAEKEAKEKKISNKDGEYGSLGEFRFEYWSYLIDQLRAENSENGLFKNTNPRKDAWIDSRFGVQGFSINCVTKMTESRVELYLGKSDGEENKKAYDYLIKYKDDIEAVLETSLLWDRLDKQKACRISYSIDLSIMNEENWTEVSEFYSKWTKKFYDAFTPYLLQ